MTYSPNTPLETIFRLSPVQKKSLRALNLHTVENLLHYFPFRYENHIPSQQIETVQKGDKVALEGIISGQKTKRSFGKGAARGEALLKDGTGSIRVLWFNQAYMAKKFEDGTLVRAQGTVGESKQGFYLANPEIESITSPGSAPGSLFEEDSPTGLVAVYPATRFLSSRWFGWRIREILSQISQHEIHDLIPEEILKQYKLPALFQALHYIHTPKNEKESIAAKKRFAFEEVFYIQLGRQKDRLALTKTKGYTILPQNQKEEFLNRFPFTPTESQEKSIDDILHDMASGITKPYQNYLKIII
jgi:ATP-dependent DNA helicase RecG